MAWRGFSQTDQAVIRSLTTQRESNIPLSDPSCLACLLSIVFTPNIRFEGDDTEERQTGFFVLILWNTFELQLHYEGNPVGPVTPPVEKHRFKAPDDKPETGQSRRRSSGSPNSGNVWW